MGAVKTLSGPMAIEKVVLRIPQSIASTLKSICTRLKTKITLGANSAIHLYLKASRAPAMSAEGKLICQIMLVPKYRMDAFRKKAQVSGHSLSKAFTMGIYLLMEELKDG
jgi:hypothetical protein